MTTVQSTVLSKTIDRLERFICGLPDDLLKQADIDSGEVRCDCCGELLRYEFNITVPPPMEDDDEEA